MRKILSTFVAAAVLCAAAHINEEAPNGTPDGTLTTFRLARPAILTSLVVTVNGLRNYQGVDYDAGVEFTAAASPSIIVFRPGSIPRAGWRVRVDYETPAPPVLVHVDAGGEGDQYFSPANGCYNGAACAYADPLMGPPPYDTLRYGYGMVPLEYRIPAPNGTCELDLTFSEPNKTAAGQRVFTITANGETVVDVDIFARAGAAKLIVHIPLTVPVLDGILRIRFTPKPGTWNAFVNGIAATCRPNP